MSRLPDSLSAAAAAFLTLALEPSLRGMSGHGMFTHVHLCLHPPKSWYIMTGVKTLTYLPLHPRADCSPLPISLQGR